MITDILAVVWKEWKEYVVFWSGRSKVGLVIFAGVFGVLLPLQMGPAWVESLMVLSFWIWLPLFQVISVIADSIAGERERHTLETLLASRLPEVAILCGKVIVAVGYGIGIVWTSLLLGFVTVNLTYGHDRLLIYPGSVGWPILGFSLLSAGLAAGTGVLVSLRASTVRQAQQTLRVAGVVLFFLPTIGLQAMPDEWKIRMVKALATVGIVRIAALVAVALALLDIVLFLAALVRFRRSRLTLE